MIDAHPTIRLGVRGLLSDRYEVDEVEDGRGALELITSIGDFDVAIVELAPTENGENRGLIGIPAIRALHKARPGLDRRPRAPAGPPGGDPCTRRGRNRLRRQELADRGARRPSTPRPTPRSSWTRRPGSAAAGAITRRQREILQHYADGLSTTTVAKRLGLGTETIRTHTKAALSRLGARDRAHAVAIGLRNSSSNNDDSPAPPGRWSEELPVAIQSQPRSRAISTA